MFNRAPTFCVGAYILYRRRCFLGLRIFCIGADVFLDLEYFMNADIFIGADILGRRHFREPTF